MSAFKRLERFQRCKFLLTPRCCIGGIDAFEKSKFQECQAGDPRSFQSPADIPPIYEVVSGKQLGRLILPPFVRGPTTLGFDARSELRGIDLVAAEKANVGGTAKAG